MVAFERMVRFAILAMVAARCVRNLVAIEVRTAE